MASDVRPSSKKRRRSSEQVVPGSSAADTIRTPAQRRGEAPPTTDEDPRRLFADPNYPIPNFDETYSKMRDEKEGLALADRRYRLQVYRTCFVGSEAVSWMVDNLGVDKEGALSVGKKLMNAGIISHVTQSEPFLDGFFFYRFQEDDDGKVLNLKRVWDSKIKTRHAVIVSQELLTQLACLCEEYRERFIASKTPNRDSNELGSQRSSEALKGPDERETSIETSTSKVANRSSADSADAPPISPSLGSFPRNVLNSLSLGSSPNLSKDQSKDPEESGDDIDFSLLAKSEAFRKYTLAASELQGVQLLGLSHDELMAFFVNIYNVLSLHAYVVHGPPNSFWRRWTFFRSLAYRISGLDFSLDCIEHGVLRGNKRAPMFPLQQFRPTDPKCQFVLKSRDGRIHFVISAGTRSDPPVRILNGENLQEELYEATVEFLSCSVKVDKEAALVTLPRIFLWYADDFATPETELLRWVAGFLPVGRSKDIISLLDAEVKVSISYESFDWNSAEARFEAAAIRRKRRKLIRERTPNNYFGDSSVFGSASNARDLEQLLTTPLLASHPLLQTNSRASPDTASQTVSVSRRQSLPAFSQIPLPALHPFTATDRKQTIYDETDGK